MPLVPALHYRLRLLISLISLLAASTAVAQAMTGEELDAEEARLRALYAAYELGLDALETGDYGIALREFRAAAEAGLDLAQYNLGVMYYSGTGVRRNVDRAYHWLTQAAEQGHRNAAFNLGVLYFNGEGVNPLWMRFWPLTLINRADNMAQAAHWYGEAADRGHGGAQYYLATMYRDGLGVEADVVLAFKWAWAARESEFPAASALLASLNRELSQTQIDQARQRHAEWELSLAPGF